MLETRIVLLFINKGNGLMNPINSAKKILNCRSGFSLIEMIMVITLVVIAIIPVINMYIQGVTGTETSEIAIAAPSLAQEKMEETQQLGFSGITVGTSSGTFAAPFDDYSYTLDVGYVTGSFTGSAGATSYKKVDVTVGHVSGSTFVLTTVISDHS